MADSLVLPRPAKSVQNGSGFSGENLSILGLPKRKEWPQCHRESRSRPCQTGKEQSRLSRVPDHDGRRVKVGESRTLARERRIRAGTWRGKGGLHRERGQIPRRKQRASNKSLPRTNRWKHERVSGRKSSPGRSAEPWSHFKSGQTGNRKRG